MTHTFNDLRREAKRLCVEAGGEPDKMLPGDRWEWMNYAAEAGISLTLNNHEKSVVDLPRFKTATQPEPGGLTEVPPRTGPGLMARIRRSLVGDASK